MIGGGRTLQRLARPIGAAAGIVLALGLATALLRDVEVLTAVVIGVQQGAVYSLVALGIALVYRATRVFNFAQGELGTVPAFVAYLATVGWTLSEGAQPVQSRLWWALPLAIAAGVVLAIVVNLVVMRPLASAPPVIGLVATVGVALLLVALELVVFEAKGRRFPRLISGAPCFESEGGVCVRELTVGGIVVPWHTIVVLAVLAAAAGGLAVFFRTSAGTALLATAQEPFAAQLQGISVRSMSLLVWGAAGALGALAGVLGAGVFENLTPGLMTGTFLIPAFVGAVLGGITTMSGAVVGGLLLGIAVALLNQINLAYDLGLPGPPQIATFGVLLLVLLLRPRGLLGREA